MFAVFTVVPSKYPDSEMPVYVAMKSAHQSLEGASAAVRAYRGKKELVISEFEMLPLAEGPTFEGNVIAFPRRA